VRVRRNINDSSIYRVDNGTQKLPSHSIVSDGLYWTQREGFVSPGPKRLHQHDCCEFVRLRSLGVPRQTAVPANCPDTDVHVRARAPRTCLQEERESVAHKQACSRTSLTHRAEAAIYCRSPWCCVMFRASAASATTASREIGSVARLWCARNDRFFYSAIRRPPTYAKRPDSCS
jgi:hypothetical protein